MKPFPLTERPTKAERDNYIEFNNRFYLKDTWLTEKVITMEMDEEVGQRYDRSEHRNVPRLRTHRMRAVITVRWFYRDHRDRFEPVFQWRLEYHRPPRRSNVQRVGEQPRSEWTQNIPCQRRADSDDSSVDLSIQLIEALHEYMNEVRLAEQVEQLANRGTKVRFSPEPRRRKIRRVEEPSVEPVLTPEVPEVRHKVAEGVKVRELADGTLVVDEDAVVEDASYDPEAERQAQLEAARQKAEQERLDREARAKEEKKAEAEKSGTPKPKKVKKNVTRDLTSEQRIAKADKKWERKMRARLKSRDLADELIEQEIKNGLAERQKKRAERMNAQKDTEQTPNVVDTEEARRILEEQAAIAKEKALSDAYGRGYTAYKEGERRTLGPVIYAPNKVKKVRGVSINARIKSFEKGWDAARDENKATLIDELGAKEGNPPKPKHTKGDLHVMLTNYGISGFNTKTKKAALIEMVADYRANTDYDGLDLRTGKAFEHAA